MSPEEGILVKRLEFPGGKSFSLVINNILNAELDVEAKVRKVRID